LEKTRPAHGCTYHRSTIPYTSRLTSRIKRACKRKPLMLSRHPYKLHCTHDLTRREQEEAGTQKNAGRACAGIPRAPTWTMMPSLMPMLHYLNQLRPLWCPSISASDAADCWWRETIKPAAYLHAPASLGSCCGCRSLGPSWDGKGHHWQALGASHGMMRASLVFGARGEASPAARARPCMYLG
jgi:hypothetical protein